MNGINYYINFEKQIREVDALDKKPTLLLHACCCPCSSHCLEVLNEHFDITIYFYNPNIDLLEENDKRYSEFIKFINAAPFAKDVKLVYGPYEPEVFYNMAKGREMLPERSERCYDCYKLRMKKSAEYADENGFDYFTTTLSISPYKNADWLNEIGVMLEQQFEKEKHPIFLFSDFKKKNGYKRSIELSAEYDLYRQDYCGCVFSKRDHDIKLKTKEAGSRSENI